VTTRTWTAVIAGTVLALAVAGTAADVRAQIAQTQTTSTLDALPFNKKLQLAKAGDEDAQMAVARAYDSGQGARKSPVDAARWYRLAAQRGNAEAQFRLARIVHMGARNLEQNLPLAAQLYEAAAKQGLHEAEYWTGYCYEQGEGVTKDLKTAVAWYTKAAAAGEASASNNLGLIYLNGNGLARDLNHAFQLFKAAADQGDQWAENNLGGMYEMGWGVAANRAEAVRLYRLAAAQGNPHAVTNLTRLGEPVEAAAGSQPPTQQQQN
jgi:TPR repeat protein